MSAFMTIDHIFSVFSLLEYLSENMHSIMQCVMIFSVAMTVTEALDRSLGEGHAGSRGSHGHCCL